MPCLVIVPPPTWLAGGRDVGLAEAEAIAGGKLGCMGSSAFLELLQALS